MCARLKEELPCIFDKEDANGMSHYLKAEFNSFMNATKYPFGSQGRSTYLGSTKVTGGQGNGEIPFCRKAAAAADKTTAAAGPRDTKEKARAALQGKRDALKGAFDNFQKKCGKGAAAKGGEAAGRSRRVAHSAANMTCVELTAAFEDNKKEAKAVYAKLKAARATCKKVTATRFARGSHAAAADDAVIAALSCKELEDEITTLKTQASAAGLSLEASTVDGGATTTAMADGGVAAAAAAGMSTLVAVAFALLA